MHDLIRSSRLEAAQSLFQMGRLDEAAKHLLEAVEADPHCGDALEGLAHIAARQGDMTLAASYFEQALPHLQATASRYHDAGLVHQAAGHHARAVVLFEQAFALARVSDQVSIFNAAAQSLTELGEFRRAAEMLTKVRDAAPGMWQAHYNLGRALGLAGRYDEEIAAYRRAIDLKPDAVDAYVNLGVALRDLHRFDEALKVFAKALRLNPNHPGARTNRAQTNLLLGQFEHGWREYEWRWRDGRQRYPFDSNAWQGDEPLEGKTILLFSEQGFGDTLQFVRYVDRVAALGARIVLRVQNELVSLLNAYPGVASVIGEGDDVPSFDYQCALMSLPHVLRAHRAPIPAVHSYLEADAERCADWRAHFDQRSTRLRVGIAWSGSLHHVDDSNRSIPLAHWKDTITACQERVEFVSLVKDVRDVDRNALCDLSVQDVSERLGTFDDTAALIAELDLVVSVDTAVAHLAGALGTDVWILLPYTPDWRWQLGRTDSPWYSSARLFRQPDRDDWMSVLEQVQAALREHVDRDRAGRIPRL